jgi:hypothetical protein
MPEEPPAVEWHNAPDFAEIAEALAVETQAIMAALNPTGGKILVLYSRYPQEPERIFAVTLLRGQDGILFAGTEPTEQVGMWEEIQKRMEEELPPLIEKRLDEEMPGWREKRDAESE